MKIGPLLITRATRTKAAPVLSPVSSRGGWWPLIREAFPGGWQRNLEWRAEDVVTFSTVYACVSLIASDISKQWLDLVKVDDDGVSTTTESPAFSPVLKRPNHYQNRIKFFEQWILSKLLRGNTYVLKVRDGRRVVTGMYVLDASRVTPMVAPNGEVFYRLQRDDLSRVAEDVMVPASEIIHDIMCALYHPLVGVTPITACGLAAMQGLRIQAHSAKMFQNLAQPGGILTGPQTITDDQARELQLRWEQEFTGDKAGRIAVLGDDMKFMPMTISSHDAQLIEQLKWTGETVCSCFHVPPYMVSVGPPPTYNNIEALNQQYYSQCLQALIESVELCLDEGLELPKPYGVEFDLDSLLRMDTATRVKAASDSVGSGCVAPDEARARWFNLGKVKGGDTPYLQMQNFSLAALARRDASADPFGKAVAPSLPATTGSTEPPSPQLPSDEAKKRLEWRLTSHPVLVHA